MEVIQRLSRVFNRYIPAVRRLYHSGYSTRTHTCGELRAEHVGEQVTLCGWMSKPRLLGQGILFVPLFDCTGVTQLVCNDKKLQNVVKSLNLESVIKINGLVINRPEKDLNKDMVTGSIEVEVDSMEVLNKSSVLPFLPYSKATNISEELMLKERHLHNRRPTMQHVLRFRSQVSNVIRQFLISKDFVEVETPTLFKPTPEGAKEFLIPTREFGEFFSLTQSPQQYKQLLMVGGVDRYFQFARCYRDEDSRADRQPEFTQIDLEMSFVTEQGIMSLTEDLVMKIFQQALPHVAQPVEPFPIMSYRQAMDEYGSDKPDTRYGFKLHNLTEKWNSICCNSKISPISKLSRFNCIVFRVPQWKEMSKQFSSYDWRDLASPLNDFDMQSATVLSVTDNKLKVLKEAFDFDSVSEAITLHKRNMHKLLTETASATAELEGEIHSEDDGYFIAFGAKGDTDNVLLSLGKLRTTLARILHNKGILPLPSDQFNCLWINQFPLFSIDDKGQLASTHHPFTSPVEDHLKLLCSAKNQDDLTKITAQHYDLVVNGWELGGGSIRVHDADVQEYILEKVLRSDVRKFSHLLKGLRHGCPPHGGIALGFDRLIAILCGLSSVRHVMAFPKSADGKDLLIGSPTQVSLEELKDYNITLLNNENKQ